MHPLYTLLVLLLVSSLHAPPCSSAAAHDTLMAGQALAVGDKLVSSNGKFALGFFQPAARTTIKKINQTQLKISSDGNLAIVNHAGTESVLWSTHIINRTQTNINTTAAVLSNNGNLVLTEGPSSDLPLWQSFDYPTDVMLLGAKFGRNKVTGLSNLGISAHTTLN